MKRKIWSVVCLTVILAGVLLLSGCGSKAGADLQTYMKGEPTLRSTIDAQLNILSPDAKATVQYEENTAKVEVTYYAMTEEEITGFETEKSIRRCESVMKDGLTQFHKDTGNRATLEIQVYGRDAQKQ